MYLKNEFFVQFYKQKVLEKEVLLGKDNNGEAEDD